MLTLGRVVGGSAAAAALQTKSLTSWPNLSYLPISMKEVINHRNFDSVAQGFSSLFHLRIRLLRRRRTRP